MWELIPVLPPTSSTVFSNLPITIKDRILQQQQEPSSSDYTSFVSPPTPYAISLTPKGYQPDFAIHFGQTLSSLGQCNEIENTEACQILFYPSSSSSSSSSSSKDNDEEEYNDRNEKSKVGVIFYGGGLVDPRSYSPIAHQLSHRYGIPTSIPIFANNLAFDFVDCDTQRVEMASHAFPHVQKWVLAGHSLGGVGAMGDLHTQLLREGKGDGTAVDSHSSVGGLALIASYVNQDAGCGAVDFSNVTGLAFASVDANLDGVLNATLLEMGKSLLPAEDTLFLTVLGGNHGNFGSYDDTTRKTVLGQNDGNATIPEYLQIDMTVMGIMSVVSRVGVSLPISQEEYVSAAKSPSSKRTKKKRSKTKTAGQKGQKGSSSKSTKSKRGV